MAGEIQEPLRLDFQAGSFHSGSISFGKYETESLCWERRSSFSHNRYLEEVEKCSKPGLVTEKKAYFEAHFRKKGFLPLTSPGETKHQTTELDIGERSGYDDGKINFMDSAYGTYGCEAQTEPLCDGTELADCISEPRKLHCTEVESYSKFEVKENLNVEGANFNTSNVSNVQVVLICAVDGNGDTSVKSQLGSSSEVQSPVESTKPRSAHPSPMVQNISDLSNMSEKNNKPMTNVLMSLNVEKKTSEAAAQRKRQMRKTPKIECGLKAKGDYDTNRREKMPRNKRIEDPPSSTLLKDPNTVHQRVNRKSSAAGTPQPCIKQDNSRLSFKCNERTRNKKEFDMKLEKGMHAKEADTDMHRLQVKSQEKGGQIKQLQNSLNFKARPLPSFYSRNKATANNAEPRRTHTNLSSNATRAYAKCKSKPVPKTTSDSCHSTLTSDSSPSSPCAVRSKDQASQVVINTTFLGRNGENEKANPKLLNKLKAPDVKKSRILDTKQRNSMSHRRS